MPPEPTFQIEDHPDPADLRLLEDQIIAYNYARTGDASGRDLAIFVRDAAGGLVAGIAGYTWGGFCEIKLLWVAESARGRGYGAQLLAAAEREAIERGARRVILDTYSFQAPDFYRRQGYAVFGQVEECPAGQTRYYLMKVLQ